LDAAQLSQAGGGTGAAGPALVVLILWIAALTAAAIVLFSRQDLTKE
jgi:ABC-type transport system involved in multi-copper enzyme maturation permease subunit